MNDEKIMAVSETAYEKYRDQWVRGMDVLKHGGDGSTPSNGSTLSAIHLRLKKIVTSIGWLIESLDGELTPPDVDALLLYAGNAGHEPGDFICTVLSMLTIMDGGYSLTTGNDDLVTQILENFNRGAGQQSTLASTRLKRRITTDGITSVARDVGSRAGKNTRVKKKKKTPGKRPSRKPSAKKRKKTARKKTDRKRKKNG